MTWQMVGAIVGGLVTFCFTAYKFYSLDKNKNENCSTHDKRLSLLEAEMKQRNENYQGMSKMIISLEKRVHEDFGKVWAGVDELKNLFISRG